MSAREQLSEEIAKLDDKRVGELLAQAQEYNRKAADRKKSSKGIMARLREIHIEGPVDFSENLDLYASEEKRVEDNLH